METPAIKPAKHFFLWAIIILFSFPAQAQTTLSIELKAPDGSPAKGTIHISGTNTDITDTAFSGNASYTLANPTAINKLNKDELLLYPNPADGRVKLQIPSEFTAYTIELYNTQGQALGTMQTGETQKTFAVPKGILLLVLRHEKNSQSLRLMVSGGVLVLNIEHPATAKKLKSTTGDDDYSISYTDPKANLESLSRNLNIPPNTTQSLSDTLDWTVKSFFVTGKTSVDASISLNSQQAENLALIATSGGYLTLTGIEKRFNAETGMNISITISAPEADTVILNQNIFPNDTITINSQLYRYYRLYLDSVLDESTIRWTDSQGTVLQQGNDTVLYLHLQQDSLSIQAIVEHSGYYNDTIDFEYVKPGSTVRNAAQEPIVYEYWLYGTSSSPDSTLIYAWKNGQIIMSDTIINAQYKTNTYQSIDTLLVIDSITASANGYETDTETNITISPGGTNKEINLEKINTYEEQIIFANQTADEYDDNLKIIIKTISDNKEHQYDIDSTQHVQKITLTGTYNPEETIEIYYEPTSANNQGKEDKILTITRSYEQPTASNGDRNTTLTTTIQELFNNNDQDTTWILSMDKTLYEDIAFRTHVAGGSEWVYEENGQRTMNTAQIQQSYNHDGTYNNDLTTTEKEELEKRANLFNQEFWKRKTGLTILKVNLTKPTTRNVIPGRVDYFYFRDEPQPGNGHYQLATTRPYTYDYGMGFVPRGTSEYLVQFTEECVQATSWIFDDAGGVTGVYAHDENNNPYLVREDDLIVPFTYVGGHAPKP